MPILNSSKQDPISLKYPHWYVQPGYCELGVTEIKRLFYE